MQLLLCNFYDFVTVLGKEAFDCISALNSSFKSPS